MNWIKATPANLKALELGAVCWCWSNDTRKPSAGVWGSDGWRCHGQEHFWISGVTRYIVLPTK